MGATIMKTSTKKKNLTRSLAVLMGSVLIAGALSACGSTDSGKGTEGTNPSQTSNNGGGQTNGGTVAPNTPEPIMVNQALPQQEILSKGPHGEAAVSAKSL